MKNTLKASECELYQLECILDSIELIPFSLMWMRKKNTFWKSGEEEIRCKSTIVFADFCSIFLQWQASNQFTYTLAHSLCKNINGLLWCTNLKFVVCILPGLPIASNESILFLYIFFRYVIFASEIPTFYIGMRTLFVWIQICLSLAFFFHTFIFHE